MWYCIFTFVYDARSLNPRMMCDFSFCFSIVVVTFLFIHFTTNMQDVFPGRAYCWQHQSVLETIPQKHLQIVNLLVSPNPRPDAVGHPTQ